MTGKLPHARAFPTSGIDRQAPFRHGTASQSGPHGQVAEWLKAADCKSARVSRTLVRIQPCPPPSNPRASAEIPRNRSEERRVGKECSVRVDLGGRRIIKKKRKKRKKN